MSRLQEIYDRIRPGRKVRGIAAALLPFRADGSIAEEDFVDHLRATRAAGLVNAVNMDTGYANLLTDGTKERVLRLTRDALGPGVEFVAGAFIEGRDGDVVALYRHEIETIRAAGGTCCGKSWRPWRRSSRLPSIRRSMRLNQTRPRWTPCAAARSATSR